MLLRELILNAPLKRESVPTPFWSRKDDKGEELVDGYLALQDMPSDELLSLQRTHKDRNEAFVGAVLVKVLIDLRTGERVFQEADRDALIKRGSAELTPLFQHVIQFLGLGEGSVIEAKKNSNETSSANSGSS